MKSISPLVMFALLSCLEDTSLNKYLTESVPGNLPVPYFPELIPENMLIHSGIFSTDLSEFYFTVSDKQFRQFDVRVVRKEDGRWSGPQDAFFNTRYNEHGTSFSPDQRFLYFTSTRPVGVDGVASTWHLWRSEKIDGRWAEPEFVDIPNLRDKLVMHPSATLDGTLYFHAGATDFSDLNIFQSEERGGRFSDAVRLPEEINFGNQQNTPFIAADGSYLLFEAASDLYLGFRDETGRWGAARALDDGINKHGHGNPYITPDQIFLFYVAGLGPNPEERWSVYWVGTEAFLGSRRNAGR